MRENNSKSKWEKYFNNNPIFGLLLNKLILFVTKISTTDVPLDYFTPHDSSHCESVEKIVKAIIKRSDIKLTELELFILLSAIWTHDIGMIEKVAKAHLKDDYSVQKKREFHDKISAWFLNHDETFKKIFDDSNIPYNLFQNYVNTINIISKFHRRKRQIDNCPKERQIRGDRIRSKLLAALLRLGDTLHVDSSRYDRRLYNILQMGSFDRTSRLHWLKSYVVSTVYLDIEKHNIVVTVDLPDPDEIDYKIDDINQAKKLKVKLDENAKRLKFIITEDILEDVLIVKDVFKENALKFYESVVVNINYCPGVKEDERDEIIGILNDLDIVLSPNTSRVIRKTLDSIKSLAKMKFAKYEYFHKQSKQLIEHLENIYKQRPCHVGLNKIIEKLKHSVDTFPKDYRETQDRQMANCQNELLEIAEQVKNERNIDLDDLRELATSKLENIEHIFLFGFSETVIMLLEYSGIVNFKNNVKIYVFECSGKRVFSITNSIEYNDGIHYSLALAERGFTNIELLPDTSFSSLLTCLSQDNVINENNSLLLYGANGISDQDRSCGHTSGHLTLALVAKHFGVPLKIIADEFKIGSIPWNPSLKRTTTDWLTGQKEILNELIKYKVKLVNYREDKIHIDLIDEIIHVKPEMVR